LAKTFGNAVLDAANASIVVAICAMAFMVIVSGGKKQLSSDGFFSAVTILSIAAYKPFLYFSSSVAETILRTGVCL
jgi:hypothetical protein